MVRSSSWSIKLLLHFARLPSDLASDQGTADSSYWNRSGRLMHLFCEMTTRRLKRFRSAVKATVLSFSFTHDVLLSEENVFDCTFESGWKKSTKFVFSLDSTNCFTRFFPRLVADNRDDVTSVFATTPVTIFIIWGPVTVNGLQNENIWFASFCTSFSSLWSLDWPASLWTYESGFDKPHMWRMFSKTLARSLAVMCHLSTAFWLRVIPMRPPDVFEYLFNDSPVSNQTKLD